MHHVIFSVSALLGTDIVTPNGIPIGVLEDMICNKDSGKTTYLILSAGAYIGQEDQLYAIHHSFFYLNGDDEVLIFDAKIGKREQGFYLDLPDHYDDATVRNYQDFTKQIIPHLSIAGHRTDTEYY